MIAKALASAADEVFLDLEDSVAPTAKAEARRAVIEALTELDWGNKVRAVRINSVACATGVRDVLELVEHAGDRLDVVIAPKVRCARDVWQLEGLLAAAEAEFGTRTPIGIEILIEECEALASVEQIATASPRIETLIFGPGDLAASQGMRLDSVGGGGEGSDGDVWRYARTKIIVAARAAGIQAIDGPFAAFSDPDGFRREAGRAALLGAVGKWAIHPSQIALASEVFSPDPADVDRARMLTCAYEDAVARGLGAVAVDGEMIDAATVRILRTVIEIAEQVAAAA